MGFPQDYLGLEPAYKDGYDLPPLMLTPDWSLNDPPDEEKPSTERATGIEPA